uniref:Putative leucine-rich repeat 47 n=1 Tax=Amblyomma triste TaxID=251400 RepID=A0A023G754_AMBTT
MRLSCDTQIVYRTLQYHNHSGRCRKAAFTVLTLCRKPEEKKPNPVAFLLICTAKNSAGTRYKVDGNIEGLFTKFCAEGKATIRIREPKHDVIISKAEPMELRQFLCLLQRVQRGDILDQRLFSAPPPKVTRIRETLCVSEQKHYPPQGFPSALKNLTIQGCSLVQLGSDVLALANLCILNLKANKLRTLPTQLNNLPLQQLTVSENCIVELHPALFGSRLCNCLEYLDVSNNQLTVLPETLCRTRWLMTLLAGHNRIEELPVGLGCLSNLRNLDVASNVLTCLPASLLNLQLNRISIFNNPLDVAAGCHIERSAAAWQTPWPLVELAAAAVVMLGKVELTAEDVPQSLLDLLSLATSCIVCQQPVFPARRASMIFRVNPRRAIIDGGELVWVPSDDFLVPMRAQLCATKCFPHC